MVLPDNIHFARNFFYIDCYLCNSDVGPDVEIHLLFLSMAITLVAAALTVPAGFGLATMLTPVVLFGYHLAVKRLLSWQLFMVPTMHGN